MSKLTVSDIKPHLEEIAAQAVAALGGQVRPTLVSPPNPEMGDMGFPCFPYAKALRRAPQQIAQDLVEALTAATADDPLVKGVKATGPYVNFVLDYAGVLGMILGEIRHGEQTFGAGDPKDADGPILIEYSSPNTNKPQHLGHVRNNLLGQTVANILAFAGHPLVRLNLINDRGIHICKSMLAYQRHGQDPTPESMGLKGDHLIGHFYVSFNTQFEAEYAQWLTTDAADAARNRWVEGDGAKKVLGSWKKRQVKAWKKANKGNKDIPEFKPDAETLHKLFAKDYKDTFFNTESTIGAATRELLVKWEQGDQDTRALWAKLNGWVEAGFAQTYERMGVHFDQIDHESQTYLLGKELVSKGLEDGTFTTSDNGAVVFDMEKIGGNGHKAVLRPDGTSLYITQDLGTAATRFDAHSPSKMIYVVGDEQNHYFKTLFGVFGQIRPESQGKMHHLSYGMVNLPNGRMKSREGTVVDADDLMNEMYKLAHKATKERYGDQIDEQETAHRAEAVGLGALKFFLMNFSPQTTMTFDPDESIKFQGRTGPFCLYAYARTASILRKVGGIESLQFDDGVLSALDSELELELIKSLAEFPQVAQDAAAGYDPSKIAGQAWKISKAMASFFNDTDHSVINAQTPEKRQARLQLIFAVNSVLETALGLLGIKTLEQM